MRVLIEYDKRLKASDMSESESDDLDRQARYY